MREFQDGQSPEAIRSAFPTFVAGCARREPAIDFLSAQAAKLHSVSDPDVLTIAAAQGRILVTHDFRTMPKHFAQVIDELVLVRTASEPGDWTNRMVQIPLR